MNDFENSKQNYTEDEFIGVLSYVPEKECWRFNLRDNYATVFHNAANVTGHSIVVVLESPHKYEFGVNPPLLDSRANEEVSSRPLNNPSSRLALIDALNSIFAKFFSDNLKPGEEYNLILTNAVKYQASLGEKLEGNITNQKRRNTNWIRHWVIEKKDFVDRVRSYQPKLILNLCTQGSVKENGKFTHINSDFLEGIGLKFADQGEVEVEALFEARESFPQKFTLQGAVERELEVAGLISNENYRNYLHPAEMTYREKSGELPELLQYNRISNKSVLEIH